ncbi:hypothetical protein Q8A73_014027 [Channa argus]|nr:hypothetical protein Q8A73_014027 [Channa argus]
MVAYALWAVGGPLGLHHLYLGRDNHALLWMLTLGGFGFGWFREVIRIPAYVSEANQNAEKPRKRFRAMVPPAISPVRFAGQVLAASVTATQNRRFKPPQAPGSTQELGPRLYRLGLAWLAFSAPLGYCIFHNTTATLYYLSDCVATLLKIFWFLPWLRGVLEYVVLMPYRILCVLTGGGYYEETWRKLLEILLKEYTEREKDALQVLSLKAEASLEDITRSYRELAKTWHPDHNPSKDAEAMFMKIHEAYEILLRRHRPQRFKYCLGFPGKKKNPGDAVVAWENKQPSRQLKRKTPIGRQLMGRVPFVVWSGAIATAHEKHCTAQASLTCSVLNDSCVYADNMDSGSSCNKSPFCLAAVSTVHELTGGRIVRRPFFLIAKPWCDWRVSRLHQRLLLPMLGQCEDINFPCDPLSPPLPPTPLSLQPLSAVVIH